jgi:hypothetical protein
MAHGGKREGAGRKPKAEEIEMIEKLSPLDELFFEAVKAGLTNKDYSFCKMFAEYRFGKPKETKDVKADLTIIWEEILTDETDEETE